ncbi:MAG: hypothetical protein IT338_16475 [Thermomicrobiales bacterium]|nr:hypothetical protein [Thermomicrobiales bacterium]
MNVAQASACARSTRGRALAAFATFGMVMLIASAGPVVAHEGHGHPARIHEGTCDDLGRVAYRLNGVGANIDLDGAPLATPEAINPSTSYQIMTSETTIDGQIPDLLASDHAVMVYESDDNMNAIACGNLGGAMEGDRLITGLAEARIPGHIGFALFQPEADGTLVTIIFGHAMAPMSASGAVDDHAHADNGDDHAHSAGDANHQENDHDAEATPHA